MSTRRNLMVSAAGAIVASARLSWEAKAAQARPDAELVAIGQNAVTFDRRQALPGVLRARTGGIQTWRRSRAPGMLRSQRWRP
jgi:hypothetical protein